MNLFESEALHISKIYTVSRYRTGTEEPERSTSRYNVNLPCYELIYFFKADSAVRFGGQRLEDRTGAIRFLPKGITDGEYVVERFSPNDCIDVYFDTDDPMPQMALCLDDMEKLAGLFAKLYQIWSEKKEGYYLQSLSIFYDIIYRIKLRRREYFTSEQERRLMPANEYMAAHFCESDFDYQAMCATTGLSYNHFKNLFIKQLGQSPVRRLTSLRMERAREMLITGQYSVTEIAAACGFDNVYYFSTVFKKHFGVAPSRYK